MVARNKVWTRRSLLGATATLAAWAHVPRYAHAAQGRDPRFVTLILRGALDGLSTVAPIGDPNYAGLRKDLALTRDGNTPALMLDSFFGLHPAMPHMARLYQKGEALVLHAIATSYRERSHFDGQDMLESGMPKPGFVDSGWMNRALQALPMGERIAAQNGLGIGAITPLIMRGKAPVLGWSPPALQHADDQLTARLLALYHERDPQLASALESGLTADRIAGRAGVQPQRSGGLKELMKITAQGAARLMAEPDGPRLAALAFDGWDTHSNEGGAIGQLANMLSGLDEAIAAFETQLGPVWKETVLMIVTEFGRTAAINGTIGTDHGTGTIAFLVGGAISGGRVITDWPGLKPQQLHDGRDLAPTTDLRAAMKGVLYDHLGLSPEILRNRIFPNSNAVAPMRGLISV